MREPELQAEKVGVKNLSSAVQEEVAIQDLCGYFKKRYPVPF